MHVVFGYPQAVWGAGRLARIPRWGWVALGLGVVLPVAVVLAGLFVLALLSGLAVLILVAGVLALRAFWRRLTGRFHDDGRRNVQVLARRDELDY